jgi:transcriptional regulator with XRE-family HTH domain
MNHQQFKSGRLGAQMTQVRAAERLGLSQSYLSQLEKGQRPITPKIARLAAQVYRLSPAALPLPDTLAEFFASSPLPASGLKVRCSKDKPRSADL